MLPENAEGGAWLAFFRAIRKAARRLDDLEAQKCKDGSRQ